MVSGVEVKPVKASPESFMVDVMAAFICELIEYMYIWYVSV